MLRTRRAVSIARRAVAATRAKNKYHITVEEKQVKVKKK